MKAILTLFTICGLGIVLAAELPDFSVSNRKFSADIYKHLSEKSGNFLVSPLSVEIVLALALVGGSGSTAEELARALNLPNDREGVQKQISPLLESLLKSEHASLSLANKMFVKEDFEINPKYREIAVNVFKSDVENVDFKDNVKAVKLINKWVEEKTNNKIQNLISPDLIDELTTLVLVNALHFKSEWENKFQTYSTSKLPFYTTPENSIDVDTMSMSHSFDYVENPELDAKFLELPYENREFTMTIVLPNKKDGLPELEKRIEEVLKPQNYERTYVHVRLPKFVTESSIKFVPILKKMGIETPFTERANFTYIGAKKDRLQISNVVQKTFINVTEDGTEAAAATAGGFVLLSLPLPKEQAKTFFWVEHPFLYYLKHKSSKNVLFMGRIIEQDNALRQ